MAAFALLVFAVGLNLSGVFEFSSGITRAMQLARRGGAVGLVLHRGAGRRGRSALHRAVHGGGARLRADAECRHRARGVPRAGHRLRIAIRSDRIGARIAARVSEARRVPLSGSKLGDIIAGFIAGFFGQVVPVYHLFYDWLKPLHYDTLPDYTQLLLLCLVIVAVQMVLALRLRRRPHFVWPFVVGALLCACCVLRQVILLATPEQYRT